MYEGMRIMPALARLPGGGLDITQRPERRSSPRARGVTEKPFFSEETERKQRHDVSDV
jgi:hypothetical protein